jgi:ribosome biogenesis protein SSF1/2
LNQTKVDDCKRVVLFHFDKEKKRIFFRHYLITTTPVGLSKSVKRVLQFRVQELNRYEDISEYVLEYVIFLVFFFMVVDLLNLK